MKMEAPKQQRHWLKGKSGKACFTPCKACKRVQMQHNQSRGITANDWGSHNDSCCDLHLIFKKERPTAHFNFIVSGKGKRWKNVFFPSLSDSSPAPEITLWCYAASVWLTELEKSTAPPAKFEGMSSTAAALAARWRIYGYRLSDKYNPETLF